MGIFYPYIAHDERAPDRRRGGGRGPRHRPARGVAVRRAGPACCTATAPTCCRTTTARSSRRTRSRPASTIPASAPSTRGSRTAAAPSTWRSPTTRRSRRSTRCCRIEGIIPALESAHALAYAAKLAPTMPQGRDPAGQSLRPRRQGHAHGRRALGAQVLLPCRSAIRSACVAMTRIAATFARLRAAGRKALIPFITAGDPAAGADRAADARAGRRRAPTSSSWACRSPTRWPTAR